jgi:hypothetical protein
LAHQYLQKIILDHAGIILSFNLQTPALLDVVSDLSNILKYLDDY